ncbi:MAG: alcohol dehydrogenase catalytic domain-containing protein [Actinomycetota bacterium]
MRALVLAGPGELSVEERPRASPGSEQALCRVRAPSIWGTDAHLIRRDYPGLWPPPYPFIPGHEWADGIVELGPGRAEMGGW